MTKIIIGIHPLKNDTVGLLPRLKMELSNIMTAILLGRVVAKPSFSCWTKFVRVYFSIRVTIYHNPCNNMQPKFKDEVWCESFPQEEVAGWSILHNIFLLPSTLFYNPSFFMLCNIAQRKANPQDLQFSFSQL